MSDPDRDAKTPRLTSTWLVHEEHAHQISERLRALAQASTDLLRGKILRSLADAAEGHARRFRRWSLEEVSASDKLRERAAWSALSLAIDEELASPAPRT